jgi:hypothetical protein
VYEKSDGQSLHGEVAFGELQKNAYANHMLYLMDLRIKTNEKTWIQTPAWLALLTCEFIFFIGHYVLEYLSWAWNHRLQFCIAIASSLIFGFFDPILLLDFFWSLEDLVIFTEDAFGFLAGFALIRLISITIKQAITMPLNHLADNFDEKKLMQDLTKKNPIQGSGHQGAGFNFDNKAACHQDVVGAIKATTTVDVLKQQYEFLQSNHALSDNFLEIMKNQYLKIIYSNLSDKDEDAFRDCINNLNPNENEMTRKFNLYTYSVKKLFEEAQRPDSVEIRSNSFFDLSSVFRY